MNIEQPKNIEEKSLRRASPLIVDFIYFSFYFLFYFLFLNLGLEISIISQTKVSDQ